MQEWVIDTETTGLSASDDRVIEIAGVELVDLRPTGRTFSMLINPQRPIPAVVTKIHGITDEMVKGKPTFRQAAGKFLKLIGDATLVAHNADFDVRMLNAELARLEQPPLDNAVVDTLELSRKVRPGGKHTLDAMCRHYKIDLSKRTKHEALIDCELLADVYVELRGGRQQGFDLVVEEKAIEFVRPVYEQRPFVSRVTAEEAEAHAAFIATLGPNSVWASYLEQQAEAA